MLSLGQDLSDRYSSEFDRFLLLQLGGECDRFSRARIGAIVL